MKDFKEIYKSNRDYKKMLEKMRLCKSSTNTHSGISRNTRPKLTVQKEKK